MFRNVAILLSLPAGSAAAGVAVIAHRRAESQAVTNVFGINGLLAKIQSNFLTPSNYVAYFMRDARFDRVLAEIRRLALLPSRAAAIELFVQRNLDVIDMENVQAVYFSTRPPEAIEAVKTSFLLAAENFLEIGRELDDAVEEYHDNGNVNAQLDMPRGEFDRCFRAIGLLANRNLRALNMAHSQVTDLSPLSTLTSLEILSLISTRVTDLSPLTSLRSLRIISVYGVPADRSPLESMKRTHGLIIL